ncbi:MAG: glycosyltransferase [Gammaproteobacteria bacterium]|nr:glycosyltransferase [Gammaproteobacteria bacterium]
MPALNEAWSIGACIDHLKAQSYPKDRYEIVVVDNGSRDGTAEISERLGVRVLEVPAGSVYRARNRAVESSSAQWIAFTDADCLADRDWLLNLWIYAKTNRCDLVSGLTLYQSVKPSLGNHLYVATHTPTMLESYVLHHNSVACNNMFVVRRLFNELGPFKEVRSGADIEFSQRVARHQYRTCFCWEAKTRHQCNLSNLAYLKRTFRIRHGQVTNSSRSGPKAFLENLATIPWRPGFRAPKPIDQHSNAKINPTAWWLYCWANRWIGFLGAQWAFSKKIWMRTW